MNYPFLKKLSALLVCLMTYAIGQLFSTRFVLFTWITIVRQFSTGKVKICNCDFYCQCPLISRKVHIPDLYFILSVVIGYLNCEWDASYESKISRRFLAIHYQYGQKKMVKKYLVKNVTEEYLNTY